MAKMPHGWYLLCGGDPEAIGNFTMYLSLLDDPAILQRLLEEEAAVEHAMQWYAGQLMQQSAMRHFHRILMP